MNKLFCWLKTLFRSFSRLGFFQDGIPISGHDYVDKEVHEKVTVTISKCEFCGEVDISWCK